MHRPPALVHTEELKVALEKLRQPPKPLVDARSDLWDGGGGENPVLGPGDPTLPGLQQDAC